MAGYGFTTDHDEIRAWIEERGGSPALEDDGWPAINFSRTPLEYRPVSWTEFFDAFESWHLVFHYDKSGREPGDFAFNFIDRALLTPREAHDDEAGINVVSEDIPPENTNPSAPKPGEPPDEIGLDKDLDQTDDAGYEF